jgi:hypothetical protein
MLHWIKGLKMKASKIEFQIGRYGFYIGFYRGCDYPTRFWVIPNPIEKEYWLTLKIFCFVFRIVLCIKQNVKGFEIYEVEWIPKFDNNGRLLPFWSVYKVKNKQELLQILKEEDGKKDNSFTPLRYGRMIA